MILISKKRILRTAGFIAAVLLSFSFSGSVSAQEALTLSISPSIIDMSADPGQEWRSSLRVININKFDLTVYLDVVNFSPKGEGGDGKFIPISQTDKDGSTIAEWFTISKEPITIPREQSIEVPITVRVPFEAAPGGHFAAILVGTRPLVAEPGQSKVQTSQMVTSLFFARVAGAIKESGSIREFRTTNKYLNSPEATFELRFENKGNVHLKPQGDIRIYNMWGQERGIVPINQNSNFGNVLPESIRKFTFTWKGEWSISDIGRYTAAATLAYGEDGRQFTNAKTNFWVIPYKLLLGILVGIIVFIVLVTWLVKIYVRSMLTMAGIDVNEYKNSKSASALNSRYQHRHNIKLHTPVRAGIVDLKTRLLQVVTLKDRLGVIMNFVIQYKLFFIGISLLLLFVLVVIMYISGANTSYRGFEVVYQNSDANVTLTSEEIIYNQLVIERGKSEIKVNPNVPKVKIINRSGNPGMGAETRLKLEAQGYEVVSLEADFSSPQAKTVVVYAVVNEKDALRLSSRLNNALVSVYDGSEKIEENVVTVYVGADVINNLGV
jgi:LytR cell envelope-related transcriptional attenuator